MVSLSTFKYGQNIQKNENMVKSCETFLNFDRNRFITAKNEFHCSQHGPKTNFGWNRQCILDALSNHRFSSPH